METGSVNRRPPTYPSPNHRRSVGQDGRVYQNWWNGGDWQPNWRPVRNGVFAQHTPIAALSRNPNQMDLYAVGQDCEIYSAWWNGNP